MILASRKDSVRAGSLSNHCCSVRYAIVTTRQFRKAFKKIKNNAELVDDLEKVVDLLTEDKPLPRKYKDHKLTGVLKEFRELHVRSDLLLVYRKHKDRLVLFLANLGSHDDLF